ncbi:MAG: class I SAM-dependent methyltransferase [Clostridiales bacterium]|nr:class I SAM-dependent methyltransferase [Clostridiales bacterium]
MLHLSPRLSTALALLAGAKTVADIGCDHGRLAVALAQGGAMAVGVDISEPSLMKARRLVQLAGQADRVELRVGDGLSPLRTGEADAVCMMGMGGTLIAKLLATITPPLAGARFAVLQPQSSQEDLRRFLYENNYHISDDRVVRDGRRLYQIIKAEPRATRQGLPAGFPEACYTVGYMAVAQREPLLPELLARQRVLAERRLREATGTAGEAKFIKQLDDIRRIECILTNSAP